jgi:hypothetical protein
MYSTTVPVFEKLGAAVVSEANLPTWAAERTRELPAKVRKPKITDATLVEA